MMGRRLTDSVAPYPQVLRPVNKGVGAIHPQLMVVWKTMSPLAEMAQEYFYPAGRGRKNLALEANSAQ
jgi:hypothetical protein